MSVNKFRNRKVKFYGMTFDSMKEAHRYNELLMMLRAGEINGLERQVPFELIPAQKDDDGRVIERAVVYRADFVYRTKKGKYIVEDVKSSATKTPEYIIKRKLLLFRHGIRIQEV